MEEKKNHFTWFYITIIIKFYHNAGFTQTFHANGHSNLTIYKATLASEQDSESVTGSKEDGYPRLLR